MVCTNCGASFHGASAWKPLAARPAQSSSDALFLRHTGRLLHWVGYPLLALALLASYGFMARIAGIPKIFFLLLAIAVVLVVVGHVLKHRGRAHA